ncbi:MAG: hypothetical protein AAFY54_15235 [Cyanobacteria bacterium J06648_10]
MTLKEQIKAEIDNLKDDDLDELYKLVKGFVESKSAPNEESFMSRMRKIKLEAPEDFSENWEQYTNGQKSFE